MQDHKYYQVLTCSENHRFLNMRYKLRIYMKFIHPARKIWQLIFPVETIYNKTKITPYKICHIRRESDI